MNRQTTSIAALVGLAAAASLVSADTTILADDFSGSGAALNGAAADVGGNWIASAGWRDDGVVGATQDSAALLAFEAQVNSQYMMSVDISNMTSQWVALGFARDTLEAPGGEVQFNDRFSNELEGISWMLYRNSTGNDVEVFGGMRTAGNLYGGDPAGIDFSTPTTLSIMIDTTGDGSSFTAQFYVDGVALLGSAATIGIAVDDINFAGLSFDYGSGGDVSIDNFSLTQVPAPAGAAVLGLAGLVSTRRRR